MIKKISYFLSNYKIQKRKLDEQTSFLHVLQATLGALLLTVLIFLIPGLLIYNLFIIESIKILLHFLIIILIIGFCFMYEIIYVKIVKTYYPKLENISFKDLVIMEGSIASLIIIIFTLFIMLIF